MSSTPDTDQARARSQASRAGRNLPAAIATGLLLVAAIALTLWQWNWGFVLLTAFGLSAGAYEVHKALRKVEMHAAILPIMLGTIAIVIGSYYNGHEPHPLMVVPQLPSQTVALVTIGLTVLAALVWRMPQGPEGFVRDSAASLFIIGYVAVLGAFVPLMIAPEDGPARVLTFILAVCASDTGGYMAGILFGKHPMAPVISPKKTWEGMAGSVVVSAMVSALCAVFLLHAPWYIGPVLGVVAAVVGTCGDLIESLIKRDVGIKDMSSFLPGHGGFMDRLDSLLVAAPAVWFTLYLMVPGA